MMKKLDLRTAMVVLAAVALGYVTCLAMPTAKAGMDRLVVSELTADHITVRRGISFGSELGPELYVPYPQVDRLVLWLHGALVSEINDDFCQTLCGFDISVKPSLPKVESSQ